MNLKGTFTFFSHRLELLSKRLRETCKRAKGERPEWEGRIERKIRHQIAQDGRRKGGPVEYDGRG